MSIHTPSGADASAVEHTACRHTTAVLDPDQAERHLRKVPAWELCDGRLVRTFHCDTFRASIAFVQAVAETAEAVNHHPNLSVEDKRRVGVVLWTHKLDGLTWLDFDLAARIDAIHRDLCGGSA